MRCKLFNVCFFFFFFDSFLRFQNSCVSTCSENYENVSDSCKPIVCNNRNAVSGSCSLVEDDTDTPAVVCYYIKANGSCNDQCDGIKVLFYFL
jgi:hypothetical protein